LRITSAGCTAAAGIYSFIANRKKTSLTNLNGWRMYWKESRAISKQRYQLLPSNWQQYATYPIPWNF
jgi:hydroxyethylthiazole kinase-like sugar kinase family protein